MSVHTLEFSKRTAVLFFIFLFVSAQTSFGQDGITLVATGSSMPEPLYLAWGEEFHKAHPKVQLRYLAEGTAESAARVLAGTGDFGGGEAPIPDKQLSEGKQRVVELPTVLIGIAIVYNAPGVKGGLRLTGPAVASIFLGKITSWRDPEIAKLNPDVKLPDLPIKVLHRTEGKGSSYILSDYLSKVSAEFQAKVGKSVSPKWPVGASIARTQDLIERLRDTPGAIGYTESNWVDRSALGAASIKNASGEFVKPNAKSIGEAASALESKMTQGFRISLTNPPGKESYPIASFTWLYVPEHAAEPERGKAVNEFLQWIYGRGQQIASDRGYAPLPASVLARVKEKVATIR
ncbi:MAG TPA: phosphate ABC transporter substrate-binding protein PstS [Candidatus Acidoferrum sp.]|nr:phosphate ABC transporter substrate-binding protein PstS [Candidatus Acidoferrum sp.]